MNLTTHPASLCLFTILTLAACNRTESSRFQPEVLPLPDQIASYEAMTVPADNPTTPERVALGRQLFYDVRLSGDGSKSCASCHDCEAGLSSRTATAPGAASSRPPRNVPTLWNIGYHPELNWDGGAASLEEQALDIWKGPAMMSADRSAVVQRLNAIPGYREQFQSVFGAEATSENVARSLAAYQRSLISASTPWDRWQAGDESAVSDSVKNGYLVFQNSGCDLCHDGVLFTDLQYHNIGIGMDQEKPDPGRFQVSGDSEQTGAFKTPTLRDVSRSAPYFHDGSKATLEEAVNVMLQGGFPNEYHDVMIEKVEITDSEKQDLLNFLEALSTECRGAKPPLPPG